MAKDIKQTLLEDISRYALMKTSTLEISGAGTYDLIKPLIGHKQGIEAKLATYPFERNVFLMMKFRQTNRDLSEFIIETLSKDGFRGVRADSDDWNITSDIYNPIAVMYCCRYGIALFDEPEATQAYSANVAYELGIMHYQRKTCLILRHKSLPATPFDLIKDLYEPYGKDLEVRTIVRRWVNRILREAKGSPIKSRNSVSTAVPLEI